MVRRTSLHSLADFFFDRMKLFFDDVDDCLHALFDVPGSCEVANVTRVRDDDRQPRFVQRHGNIDFITAGGFHHDQFYVTPPPETSRAV